MKKGTSYKARYATMINNLTLEEMDREVIRLAWLDYLVRIDESAIRDWRWRNTTQICVIILSLLIPVIEKSEPTGRSVTST